MGELAEFCEDRKIRLDIASVAHPQANGQVERANGLILQGIRPCLEAPLRRAAGAWADELTAVIWSLRTTPNRSTGYTPFFLVYGAEAVLPSDIAHISPRVAAYIEEDAEVSRQDDLDILEEVRVVAEQRSTAYQQKLRRYHSRRVKNRTFKKGDLVLRLVQQRKHKLSPIWEGPFMVSRVLHNGSYYLIDMRPVKERPDTRKQKRAGGSTNPDEIDGP